MNTIAIIPQSFADRRAAGYSSHTPLAGIVTLNLEECQYILDNHNKKNRAVNLSAQRKVRNQLAKHGWIYNGEAIAFYSDGHLHEGQHRLTELTSLLSGDDTITVAMTWGADPDSVRLCGLPTQRSQRAEIERHDKTITADEAATVADIAKRRNEQGRWSLENCLLYWNQWKKPARRGIEICQDLDALEKFSPQRKAMRAFAALCSANGLEEDAILLLEMLTAEISGNGGARLTSSFIETWDTLALDVSIERRLTLLFRMLCQALTQLRKIPGGALELSFDPMKTDHIETRITGQYR